MKKRSGITRWGFLWLALSCGLGPSAMGLASPVQQSEPFILHRPRTSPHTLFTLRNPRIIGAPEELLQRFYTSLEKLVKASKAYQNSPDFTKNLKITIDHFRKEIHQTMNKAYFSKNSRQQSIHLINSLQSIIEQLPSFVCCLLPIQEDLQTWLNQLQGMVGQATTQTFRLCSPSEDACSLRSFPSPLNSSKTGAPKERRHAVDFYEEVLAKIRSFRALLGDSLAPLPPKKRPADAISLTSPTISPSYAKVHRQGGSTPWPSQSPLSSSLPFYEEGRAKAHHLRSLLGDSLLPFSKKEAKNRTLFSPSYRKVRRQGGSSTMALSHNLSIPKSSFLIEKE